MVCCLYSGGAHRRPPMHRTVAQGCAPAPHTHCCRRSPRQIRYHICIPKLLRKAARDAVSKHPSYVMNIAVCRGMPQCQILLYCRHHPQADGTSFSIASCTPTILPSLECTGRSPCLCSYALDETRRRYRLRRCGWCVQHCRFPPRIASGKKDAKEENKPSFASLQRKEPLRLYRHSGSLRHYCEC